MDIWGSGRSDGFRGRCPRTNPLVALPNRLRRGLYLVFWPRSLEGSRRAPMTWEAAGVVVVDRPSGASLGARPTRTRRRKEAACDQSSGDAFC